MCLLSTSTFVAININISLCGTLQHKSTLILKTQNMSNEGL